MKFILFLIMVLYLLPSLAQKNIKIVAVKKGNKTILYAENHEVYTVSILLELDLKNMSSSNGIKKIYIVPEKTKDFKLTELKALNGDKASYTFHFTNVFGDVSQERIISNYAYSLPYKKGLQFTVEQGYNGNFSHKNENALDFNMPVGTEIFAAREGTVVDIFDTFIGACLDDVCKKKANYVLIAHNDGSFANYAHIQYKGAKVAIGDKVDKGSLIASSGNTGYTKGPHLHFVVFIPHLKEKETIPTLFKIGNGNVFEYLKQGKTYKKRYN